MQPNPSCFVSCHFPYISIILLWFPDRIMTEWYFAVHLHWVWFNSAAFWFLFWLHNYGINTHHTLIIRHRAQLCCVRKKKKGRRKHLLAVKVEWLWKRGVWFQSRQNGEKRRIHKSKDTQRWNLIQSSALKTGSDKPLFIHSHVNKAWLNKSVQCEWGRSVTYCSWFIFISFYSLQTEAVQWPRGDKPKTASPQHDIMDSVMLSPRQLQLEILSTGSGLVLATDSYSC